MKIVHRCLPFLFVTLTALGLLGCGGVQHYVEARSADLSDCVRVRAALGQVGLYAEAEATSLVHPSVGFLDVSLLPNFTAGWDPDHSNDPGQVRTAAFPGLLLGWWYYGQHETASGYGDTHPYRRGFLAPFILMGNHHVEGRTNALFHLDRLIPNPRIDVPGAPAPDTRRLRDQMWVGGSATGLIASFGAGFNLLEFFDLVAGIFSWDPLGDDYRGVPSFRELDSPDGRPDPSEEPTPIPAQNDNNEKSNDEHGND